MWKMFATESGNRQYAVVQHDDTWRLSDKSNADPANLTDRELPRAMRHIKKEYGHMIVSFLVYEAE